MSSLQKRAWLALWAMCPPYVAYFAIQALLPQLATTLPERLGLLAIVAGSHAVAYVAGLLLIKRREVGEPLLQDERDRAIDSRATRAAYFIVLTGLIVVGVVMPFNNTGWQLVNAALFFIVLAETARYGLILNNYRQRRLAL